MKRTITRTLAATLLAVGALSGTYALGASSATADAPRVKAVDVARGHAERATWHGFTVGQVIVCPKGMTVSVDETRVKGRTWAACM
jgi:hypothetical protein